MYRVVFLDVDGVLNSTQGPQGSDQLQKENLLAFASIFKQLKPAPHIVVSSTWKYKQDSLDTLQAALVDVGVLEKGSTFLSHTPDLRDNGPGFPKENAHNTRTDEILTWLKFNTCTTEKQEGRERGFPLPYNTPSLAEWTDELTKRCIGPNAGGMGWRLHHPIELENFVVVDDINLLEHGCLRKSLEFNFVRTDAESGLTDPLAKEVVKLFQTKFNFQQWRKKWFASCSNPTCLLKARPDAKDSKDAKDKDNDNTLGSKLKRLFVS